MKTVALQKHKTEERRKHINTAVAAQTQPLTHACWAAKSAAANCRFEASVAVPLEDSLAASCRLCGNFSKHGTLLSMFALNEIDSSLGALRNFPAEAEVCAKPF